MVVITNVINNNHINTIVIAENFPHFLFIFEFSCASFLHSVKTSFGISFIETLIIRGKITISSR